MLRRAQTVHAYNICAGIQKSLGGRGRVDAFGGLILVFEADVTMTEVQSSWRAPRKAAPP